MRYLLLAVLLSGCVTVPCNCRIPAPPAALLEVPPPLPPVPADLPGARPR